MIARSEENKVRVFLVDDHDVVRFGIAQLVAHQKDMMVCGEAASPREALEALPAARPDCLILDITLKEGDGLELLKTLRLNFPSILVLVLSMHDENLWAEVALRAGAKGYIMKERGIRDLLAGIRRVMSGHIFVSEEVSAKLVQRQLEPGTVFVGSPLERLSTRELQVLQQIAEWKSTRQIAENLNLSIKTIEYYREKIKEKLQLNNATELSQFATEHLGSRQPSTQYIADPRGNTDAPPGGIALIS